MNLQARIKNDLKAAMKAKDEARVAAIRVLLGEFQRQAKKELDDREVVGIIRKLIKAEEETMAKGGGGRSTYLEVLEGYLPRQASEEEIRAWISENIDFGQFKNKMQAMKPIMAHFAGTADGNTVRKVLESM